MYSSVYEKNYRNGELSNIVNYDDKGKKISMTPYKNGKKDGISITWDDKGRKNSEVPYKKGKKDGTAFYWNFGENKRQIQYVNGTEVK